jgi:protein-S-isoprenylcysteine O-methyltransferase Ste14
MNTIERAFRLLNTETACLGVFVAAVSVAAAVLIVLTLARQARLRLVPALLILGAGCLVATGTVHASYDAWYTHRCVDHHSDIQECDAGRPWGH